MVAFVPRSTTRKLMGHQASDPGLACTLILEPNSTAAFAAAFI